MIFMAGIAKLWKLCHRIYLRVFALFYVQPVQKRAIFNSGKNIINAPVNLKFHLLLKFYYHYFNNIESRELSDLLNNNTWTSARFLCKYVLTLEKIIGPRIVAERLDWADPLHILNIPLLSPKHNDIVL